jgi:hypothetical protein
MGFPPGKKIFRPRLVKPNSSKRLGIAIAVLIIAGLCFLVQYLIREVSRVNFPEPTERHRELFSRHLRENFGQDVPVERVVYVDADRSGMVAILETRSLPTPGQFQYSKELAGYRSIGPRKTEFVFGGRVYWFIKNDDRVLSVEAQSVSGLKDILNSAERKGRLNKLAPK